MRFFNAKASGFRCRPQKCQHSPERKGCAAYVKIGFLEDSKIGLLKSIWRIQMIFGGFNLLILVVKFLHM